MGEPAAAASTACEMHAAPPTAKSDAPMRTSLHAQSPAREMTCSSSSIRVTAATGVWNMPRMRAVMLLKAGLGVTPARPKARVAASRAASSRACITCRVLSGGGTIKRCCCVAVGGSWTPCCVAGCVVSGWMGGGGACLCLSGSGAAAAAAAAPPGDAAAAPGASCMSMGKDASGGKGLWPAKVVCSNCSKRRTNWLDKQAPI